MRFILHSSAATVSSSNLEWCIDIDKEITYYVGFIEQGNHLNNLLLKKRSVDRKLM